MEGLKVSFPATVKFLPENLLSLFSRPGKILEAKVETIEGRLLTLFVGEERLEALLSPEVLPRRLHPGQTVRLKVVRTGHPVVLSLLSAGEPSPTRDLYQKIRSLLKVLPRLQARAVRSSLPEGPYLESLLLRIFEVLGEEQRAHEVQAKSHGGEEREHLVSLLPRLWEAGVFFLPLAFFDRVSWGFLEEEGKGEASCGRTFRLRLFLSRLGAMEFLFRLGLKGELSLSILAAREEALKTLREELASLHEELSARYPRVQIEMGFLETLPGSLLATEG